MSINLVCNDRPRAICIHGGAIYCSTGLHYIIFILNIQNIWENIFIYKIEPDMHGQIKLNQPREYTREKIMNQGRPGKRANCCSAEGGRVSFESAVGVTLTPQLRGRVVVWRASRRLACHNQLDLRLLARLSDNLVDLLVALALQWPAIPLDNLVTCVTHRQQTD